MMIVMVSMVVKIEGWNTAWYTVERRLLQEVDQQFHAFVPKILHVYYGLRLLEWFGHNLILMRIRTGERSLGARY